MWMEARKDGKFKYREWYVDPYTEEKKKISVTLNSKSRQAHNEAKRLLDEKISKILNKPLLSSSTITFGEVLTEWETQYKQQVKSSSFYASRHSLITLQEQIPPRVLIKNIDHVLINDVLTDLLYGKKALSNSYVSKIKGRLNLILKFAISKGYIENNPMAKVELKYKKENNTSVKSFFLEDSEYDELIELTANHNLRYSLLFQWLYLNGLRAGEALGMKHSDITIDKDNGIYKASINGTLEYHGVKINDQNKSDTAKTNASMREIDISKKSVSIYSELRELNKEINSDFVFCTTKGTPIQITAVNTYLRVYVIPKLSFNKKISSHIFRHTHISKLAEIGTPLYAIKDRVGHESSKITEEIYLHVTDSVREEIKKDIELL